MQFFCIFAACFIKNNNNDDEKNWFISADSHPAAGLFRHR
jgi:hypothetical protein